MANIRVEVPDTQIEAAAKAEIKKLQKEVTRLNNKVRKLEQEKADVEYRAQRIRGLYDEIHGLAERLKEAFDLFDYDGYC